MRGRASIAHPCWQRNRDHDPAVSGIAQLENELLIRDFVDRFSDGDLVALEPLIHPHIVYQPSSTRAIYGRKGVMEMCRDIHQSFQSVRMNLLHVAASGSSVITEQTLRLTLVDEEPHCLISFASYDLQDFQIVGWRQLHG
jgi:limonene-1,2-epoxide hydrolase